MPRTDGCKSVSYFTLEKEWCILQKEIKRLIMRRMSNEIKEMSK